MSESSWPAAEDDAPQLRLEPRPRNRVVVSDAFELLATLPDDSVDLLVTDPPYESLQLHRSRGTTTRLTTNWFTTVPNARLPELLAAVYRVLRRDRHFYLFCDEVTADIIKQQQGIGAERLPNGARRCEAGFVYWKEILWAKTTLRASTGFSTPLAARSRRNKSNWPPSTAPRPSPHAASITTTSPRRAIGSTENATPAHSAATMRWTRTAIASSSSRRPAVARAASALAL